MRPPTPLDAHAVQCFATECQVAAGIFLDPADSFDALGAVYAVLRCRPDTPSARYLSSVAPALVRLSHALFAWSACRTAAPDSWSGLPARTRVAQALDAILLRHTRPSLSLRDVAAQLRISDTYLCEVLVRVSGRGFLSHLHAVRVLHALVLLAQTDVTIEAIARECGYLQASHLNCHFRNLLGTTPTRFRRLSGVRDRETYELQTKSWIRIPPTH